MHKSVGILFITALSFSSVGMVSAQPATTSIAKHKCSIKETAGTIVLGNGVIECAFDTKRGGSLTDLRDMEHPTVRFHAPNENLSGEWSIDLLNDGVIASSGSRYVKSECTSGSGESVFKIYSSTSGGQLLQMYSLKDTGRSLKCRAEYRNDRNTKAMIGRYGFTLANLAIGGKLDHNRFLYPPTFFHFMKGDMSRAIAP